MSLPTVEDVLSFASASHRLYDAVHSDQQVPRSHFLRLYEPPRKAGFYDYWRALRWRRVLTPEVVADLFLGPFFPVFVSFLHVTVATN